jgi:hypothetical protein
MSKSLLLRRKNSGMLLYVVFVVVVNLIFVVVVVVFFFFFFFFYGFNSRGVWNKLTNPVRVVKLKEIRNNPFCFVLFDF